jgi:16S rRNA (cytidine1402-2'-O)-methyltransferase
VVAFESPNRLVATLRSLASVAPEREVAVCRELTKKFEEVVRGSATELAARFVEAPKGEVTLVLGPGGRGPDEGVAEAARQAVVELVAAGTPRKVAAEVVSRLTGHSRNELYRTSL